MKILVPSGRTVESLRQQNIQATEQSMDDVDTIAQSPQCYQHETESFVQQESSIALKRSATLPPGPVWESRRGIGRSMRKMKRKND